MNIFTIYGERCTGTNFLKKIILDNFDVPYRMLPSGLCGWKHWFGSPENKNAIQKSTDCMILLIVRNPIDTLMSFYSHAHNQPKERLVNLETFLTSEFYSVEGLLNEEIRLDSHFEEDGRRFKNIFEMRSVKNRFLFLTIPQLTPNSYFIRYEDLKINPCKILADLEVKFQLPRKSDNYIIEQFRVRPQHMLDNVFSLSNKPLQEKYKVEDPYIKDIIKNNLDFEVEEMIGYNKGSIIHQLE